MKAAVKDFGALPGGRRAKLYTVENASGMSVSLSDYGARVVNLLVPDRMGKLADVALGYDDVTPYIDNDACLGATCGRVANRIGGGVFTLNGIAYHTPKNVGDTTLHGGINGFHRRLWTGEQLADGVRFTYHSADGEEGFPGALDVCVTYRLGENNALSIRYDAVSDADTVVNLTNHTYFNLAGHDSGDMLAQTLSINARYYTPLREGLLPSGEIRFVAGTPFDFTAEKPIGRDIAADHEQIRLGGGFDHNFVLDKAEPGCMSLAARAADPVSGRKMEVWTDKPGIQLYTSNMLDVQTGKSGAKYGHFSAYCLETQFFPNAMANPHFPSAVLKQGAPYRDTTEYRF